MASDIVDLLSILDPVKDQNTRHPIDEKKLKEALEAIQSAINVDLARNDGTIIQKTTSTQNVNLFTDDEDLEARVKYLEGKNVNGSSVTGLFYQKNTGDNENPVWENKFAIGLQSDGSLHLSQNSNAIRFPDGTTLSSESFNSDGEVVKFKGNDIDQDGDGSVDQADNAKSVGTTVASGTVQLNDGSAIVSTGEDDTNNTYFLALGVEDPNNDTKISARLFWDNSAGEHKLEIVETDTNIGNPTAVYEVVKL